jgi:hypothetical protein
LWFEIPSYSIHVVEPTRRLGRRLRCAFQFPIRKSKSWPPSCGGAGWAGATWVASRRIAAHRDAAGGEVV